MLGSYKSALGTSIHRLLSGLKLLFPPPKKGRFTLQEFGNTLGQRMTREVNLSFVGYQFRGKCLFGLKRKMLLEKSHHQHNRSPTSRLEKSKNLKLLLLKHILFLSIKSFPSAFRIISKEGNPAKKREV